MDKYLGRGYSKVILFGEHFVVYGLPGIASGIDTFVEVEITKQNENDINIETHRYYSFLHTEPEKYDENLLYQ